MIDPFFDQVLPGVTHISPVRGGDINQAFALSVGDRTYFCKVQEAGRGVPMFRTEAAGLEALRAHFPRIPAVFGTGVVGEKAFLLLEWLAPGPSNWAQLGEDLARLHLWKAPGFGFPEDNFIGILPQDNTHEADWRTFFLQRRLLPLLRKGAERGLFSINILGLATQLPIQPGRPSLLHGDLWSGNVLAGPGGIWLVDPAVYYGHREMDLAMTRLFGGFPPTFYEAYAYHYPPEPGWAERVALCQLYPLLVHALLFEGGYVQEVQEIIRTFTGAV